MSDVAIKVENLSKLYKIGARRNRHDTLRDHLVHGIQSLFSRNGQPSSVGGLSSRGHSSAVSGQSPASDYIWALKDVSFEIKKGEVVGFIGRNGAGKSTLLKILSRITEPTSGRAEIFGRVASLLEVGTGFHGELTGRENIYLNGAILGMKGWEIDKKFDEIVAFSEIEKFIDTPVKRYSSGMYVRLAFAVAAHLEPEILIVDEVLAVGDASFQKKCLGKMGDVAKEGRTVLFVSHNVASINRLCTRAVWLQNGRVMRSGAPTEIIGNYLAQGTKNTPQALFDRRSNAKIQYRSVCVRDNKGSVSQYIPDNQEFEIEFEVEAYEATPEIYFGIILQNSEGINVLFADSRDVELSLPSRLQTGRYNGSLCFPPIFAAGRYSIALGIASCDPFSQLDEIQSACSFEIVKNSNARRVAPRPGIVDLRLPWNWEERNK